MRRVLACALLALACSEPKPQCACGHVEVVHRKAYTTHGVMFVGKTMIPTTHHHPARDVRVFVCDRFDQWEETR